MGRAPLRKHRDWWKPRYLGPGVERGGDRAVVVRVWCFLLRGGEGSAKWVGILGSGPGGLEES